MTEVGRPRGNSLSASLLFGFTVSLLSQREETEQRSGSGMGRRKQTITSILALLRVESNLRVSSTLPFRVFRSHMLAMRFTIFAVIFGFEVFPLPLASGLGLHP